MGGADRCGTAAGSPDWVLAADVLVIASPTCKASYSGPLKSFLDRFGTGALAGRTAVPVMLGGLFVLEPGVAGFASAAAAWAKENAAALAPGGPGGGC